MMQSSTGRKVATIHVLPPSPQSDASSPAGESTTKHKKRKKVNKRGSDNLFLWLLRRLCRHLSGAFLLHHTTLIESFPVSLDLITSFYRLLGFSFSACRYIEVQSTFGGGGDNQIVDPLHLNNRYQFRLTVWQKSAKAVLKRYLGLLLNLFLLFLYLAPFLRIHFSEKNGSEVVRYANDTTSTTSNYTAIRFEDFGHFTTTIIQGISGGGSAGSSNGKASSSDENSDMSQLKPILRLIMEWLMYVFMFNGFFSVAYNLLFGGALLHHLVGIGDFADLDDSRSLAVRLLGATLGAILTIKLATMSLYQSELLKLFFEDNESDQHYDPNFLAVKRPVMLVNLVAELLATTGHYLILSMISVFFLYSMIMFKRSIEALQAELLATVTANSMTGETADGSGGGPELDEHQLTVLKTRLYRLNEAFKRAVLFFSVPLTLDLIANCYMLIGSACFLIIRSNNRNIRPYAITFVANIGLFALLRLVVVASAGNLPGAAAASLLRTVYEAKAEWTLGEWLAYLDIKRAPAEFAVSVFSVFTVQQSSILTICAFSLNYIVILLQTESYSSGTAAANGTANSSVP